MQRRTRIVATLGPATDPPGVLEAVLRAGVDVVRINFSHGSPAEHQDRIAALRRAARAVGRPVAVLADLPGPKLRALLPAPLALAEGQEVTLGEGAAIGVTDPEIVRDVQPGQRLLLDDGRLELQAVRYDGPRLVARVTAGGTLLPNKGINLPETALSIPALTERDQAALVVAAAAGVDWLALSFVREAAAADALRAAAHALGLKVPVLAKIERPEAVRRAGEIVEAFDGIMVARGDLGVEIPLERVPPVQKRLILQARMASKPVITATDMLDSMRENPRPTRAEASDVANAIYDGTDAVMLSGETAIGRYPVEAVACMDRIARETEPHFADEEQRFLVVPREDIEDQMAHIACTLAREIQASAIVAPTYSGRTACLVARHRPRATVVAPAPSEAAVRQLMLVWGVWPVPLVASLHTGADRIEASVRAAFEHGAVQAGDLVVVLAGHPLEAGELLPTVRVLRVGEGGRAAPPA